MERNAPPAVLVSRSAPQRASISFFRRNSRKKKRAPDASRKSLESFPSKRKNTDSIVKEYEAGSRGRLVLFTDELPRCCQPRAFVFALYRVAWSCPASCVVFSVVPWPRKTGPIHHASIPLSPFKQLKALGKRFDLAIERLTEKKRGGNIWDISPIYANIFSPFL